MPKDQFSPDKRSWIMSRIKSNDNPAEVKLRKALWKRGLRYRIHSKIVIGAPDILFTKAKVAVFVDGAFWHGKKLSEDRLRKMSPYWQNKIHTNQARDTNVNDQLKEQGYQVARFEEHDVIKNTETIAEQIRQMVSER